MISEIDTRYDQLRIVAFDGSVSSPCAPVLPVVYWAEHGLYFKLSTRESLLAPKTFQSEDDFKKLVNRGLITELPEPHVRPFAGALLVYAAPDFLRHLGLGHDYPSFRKFNIKHEPWTVSNETSVLCFRKEDAHGFLNHCGEIFSTKAEESLRVYQISQEPKYLTRTETYLNFAFDAATDKSLRLELYVLDGVLKAETGNAKRLHSIFELLIKSEFPDLTQLTFQEYLRRVSGVSSQMRKVAAARRKYSGLRSADPDHRRRDRKDELIKRRFIKDLKETQAILKQICSIQDKKEAFEEPETVPSPDEDEIAARAQSLAAKYSANFNFNEQTQLTAINRLLQENVLSKVGEDYIYSLDLPSLLAIALATEELFWHLADAFSFRTSKSENGKSTKICTVDVIQLTTGFQKASTRGLKPKRFMKKIERALGLEESLVATDSG